METLELKESETEINFLHGLNRTEITGKSKFEDRTTEIA